MCRLTLALAALGSLLTTVSSLSAQETRPLAITNARILTLESEVIENGTILIRDGKIAEVGAKVTIPPGSRIIDAEGGSVMPGLVSAWSRAGLTRAATPRPTPRQRGRGRRGRGARPSAGRSSASNRAASKIADGIYARQDIFAELLQTGITTLAVHPIGNGFPGQAALLNPAARNSEQLAIDDQLFLTLIPEKSSGGRKVVTDALDAAKKLLEERNKPEKAPEPAKPVETKSEAAKPSDKKPDEKPSEKPKEDKPEPKPEEKQDPKSPPKDVKPPASKSKPKAKKTDPNIEALADLLEGKKHAFVQVASANDLAHYLETIGEHEFTTTIVAASAAPQGFMRFRRRGSGNAGGNLTLMLDQLKKLKAPVLMQAKLSTKTGTDILINEPAMLADAGIEVGFLIGDSKLASRGIFFKLIDLVRHGLSRDTALKAVTLTPAKMLKLDQEAGSIKVGKQANLLLFSGDPLDPRSKMLSVFYQGKQITEGR